MTRIGYQYNAGTSLTSSSEDFRTFLSTRLTTWTVGIMRSFESGTTERNYFTLSSTLSGTEILVVMPNGISSSLLDCVRTEFILSGGVTQSIDQTITMSVAMDGGFEANFDLGRDPKTDANFYPSKCTQFTPMDFWIKGGQPCVFYIIEDTLQPALHFYTGNVAGNVGYNYWGYDQDHLTFDIVPTGPDVVFTTEAVLYLYATKTTGFTPRPPSIINSWFDYVGQTESFISGQTTSLTPPGLLTLFTDTNQPNPDNVSYASGRLSAYYEDLGIDFSGFVGQYDSKIHRDFGLTDSTFGKKLTSPQGDTFIHIFERMLSPWAGNLPDLN